MMRNHPRILRIQPGNKVSCIKRAAEVLANGSLVIIPTDTVYGIAADPRAPGAVEHLFDAKGRDHDKPIPMLAACVEDVEKAGVVLSDVERRLAAKFWPGPLTLVLDTGLQAEGFRVPDFELTLMLLREVGGVLRVTSANLSGKPPALTVLDAVAAVGGFVELALDAGLSPGGTPSTVAKVEDGAVRILREGVVPFAALERECRNG
jgi:L-threonylcarbamoyladenylate synthase